MLNIMRRLASDLVPLVLCDVLDGNLFTTMQLFSKIFTDATETEAAAVIEH